MIRRKAMVHGIIAMIRYQYVFLVEVKRDIRKIMCPRLMTGEVRQCEILYYQF